jgi:hypothetical protein
LIKDFVRVLGEKFLWGGNSDFYEVIGNNGSDVGKFGKGGFHRVL